MQHQEGETITWQIDTVRYK